ncbi:hypothetical protein KSP40_PGU022249 [Platanthera guangdongensis]|uniref:Uncharacterized protein n=1 Tax=Platanthera guangdongensis TaxID=2320717 RepID=A0ABR2M9S0_9ASPA
MAVEERGLLVSLSCRRSWQNSRWRPRRRRSKLTASTESFVDKERKRSCFFFAKVIQWWLWERSVEKEGQAPVGKLRWER